MSPALSDETLPPLENGASPATFDETCSDYDPRVEPLDTEALKKWEEDGAAIRAVRYRIGTFKGEKSWMGGVYTRSRREGKDLPAIRQVHGGGGGVQQECLHSKRGARLRYFLAELAC